ncbi:hypothetical protein MMC20_004823 [Loxospora ochrophaea]|nr:hypothetical protein [Loxospora ochrophaea]
MASTPSSQALAKRSSDSALMPPPPPPKRIKRPAKVLDEDSYTDALSHIIARDFFPGLVETESQQYYLNALESKNPEWISEASQKLTQVMTPGPDGRRLRGRRGTSMTPLTTFGETPKGFTGDTPMSVISTTSTTQTETPSVDTNMSLSAFQSKYTSEDNESFYKLLDKQNSKKAERYNWIYSGNKILAPRQIAYRNREAKLLASKTSSEKNDPTGNQQLVFKDPDSRPANPDTWPSRPSNSLMFAPSSVEETTETVFQKSESASRAPPKAVVYDNTRLPPPAPQSSSEDPSVPPSPSLSAVHDALTGRPRPTDSEPGYSGGSTPRVNGYAFVDSEPDPEPEPPASFPSSSSLLSGGDATPNPFTIKERSKREDLHHRMVDKVAKGKRLGKREAEIKTPVPRFMSSPRVGAKGGLTPAGQNLLGRVGAKNSVDGSSVWEGRGKMQTQTQTPAGKGSRLRVGGTPV